MSELLLIDDDEELCELLSSWLSQEGFQVQACHDGSSARLALAQTPPPAAVVLDVMLPDGSGLELLKQLRTDHPDLPVLMLSLAANRLTVSSASNWAPTITWPNPATLGNSPPGCARCYDAAIRQRPQASWNWATCVSARCAAW